MRHRVFSIFDSKAVAYLPPFACPERGMAQRTFSDAVADSKHSFGIHPEDYTLFEIGFFDDNSGVISAHNAPELVCTGLSCLSAPPGPTVDPDLFNGSD